MNYTIIYTSCLSGTSNPQKYLPGDNEIGRLDYMEGPFLYPLNHVLLSRIDEEIESVKVIILEAEGIESMERNTGICRDEVTRLLSGKTDKVEFCQVEYRNDGSRQEIGRVFKAITSNIIPGSKVISDVTYGYKFIPELIMISMNYSKMFSGCDSDICAYGLIEWGPNRTIKKAQLNELSSLLSIVDFAKYYGSNKEKFDKFLEGFFK